MITKTILISNDKYHHLSSNITTSSVYWTYISVFNMFKSSLLLRILYLTPSTCEQRVDCLLASFIAGCLTSLKLNIDILGLCQTKNSSEDTRTLKINIANKLYKCSSSKDYILSLYIILFACYIVLFTCLCIFLTFTFCQFMVI